MNKPRIIQTSEGAICEMRFCEADDGADDDVDRNVLYVFGRGASSQEAYDNFIFALDEKVSAAFTELEAAFAALDVVDNMVARVKSIYGEEAYEEALSRAAAKRAGDLA